MAGHISDVVYSHSPVWVQNVLVSLRGWEYRHVRSNDILIRQQASFLEKSEQWSADDFDKYQTEQMRFLLSVAFEHVPWYRELKRQMGCNVEDFRTVEDLRLLPLLNKSQVRGQEHLFVNESVNLGKASRGFTSGTTGTPINYFETQQTFSQRWAFIVRLRRWAGLADPFYPKRAQFTGRNIVPPNQNHRVPVYWRWNKPGNSLLFSLNARIRISQS